MISNPYDVLGVKPGVTDDAVRRAYLELVKRCPPDTHPAAFSRINDAFEKLKTEKARLHYELFSMDPGIERPFDALVGQIQLERKRRPPDFNTMMRFLSECMNKTK